MAPICENNTAQSEPISATLINSQQGNRNNGKQLPQSNPKRLNKCELIAVCCESNCGALGIANTENKRIMEVSKLGKP